MRNPSANLHPIILYSKVLFFCFFILLYNNARAQELRGKATYFSDGDSFRFLTHDNIKLKIRIAFIDCPEKVQPYGLEAKEFIMQQIQNKELYLQIIDTDRYGRKVAKVCYKGKNLAEELLEKGYAWHYKEHSDDIRLAKLEQRARRKRVGLWMDDNPVAPWEFRKNKKKAAKNNRKKIQ